MCHAFPREPTWCPALLPASHAPRSSAHPHLCLLLSRTRGVHHRGQSLWPERPGTPLLLLVVATLRGPGAGPLGQPDPPLGGSSQAPPPPLPAPKARDGVHTFLPTQEVTAVRGVNLVQPSPATPDDPRVPTALSPAPDRAVAQGMGGMACPPPAPMSLDDHWPLTTRGYNHDPPPPPAPHGNAPRHATNALEIVGQAHLTPRTPDRLAAMSDSHASCQRDNRLHRRSRSRSPVSPGCAGGTPAGRGERRLVEAAVPDWAASQAAGSPKRT